MSHESFQIYASGLKNPYESTPPTIVCRDVDAMYDDFLNHMVLTEVRCIIAPSNWSCAYGYVQFYFSVTSLYDTRC